MLHVHSGDCAAEVMRRAGMPGDMTVLSDPVWEGPTPAGVPADAWRLARTEYLVKHAARKTLDEMRWWLVRQSEWIARFIDYEEVVFWVDACMYDQTILIYLIDAAFRLELKETKLSLISVGEFPGVPRFTGLGDLNPAQMASLFPKRVPLTRREQVLARQAWAAYCSPEPTTLERFLRTDTSPLPHLREALIRHLEEFPSTASGLSRLEREALEVVDAGEGRLPGIFAGVSAREAHPFFGDTALWTVLEGLASGRVPALSIDGPSRLPRFDDPPADLSQWTVHITNTGRALLAGHADRVALNGIDRWLGGVHLHGPQAAWRWSARERRLVRCPV